MQVVASADIGEIVSYGINKIGVLPKLSKIFRRTKFMLRSNINIGKGLVMGTVETTTEIIWPNFHRAQKYTDDVQGVCVDFGRNGIRLIELEYVLFPAKKSL